MNLQALIHARRDDFHLKTRLDLEAGATLAVLGPNGSGKSTLVRCLAGLHPLEEGVIQAGTTLLEKPAEKIFLPPHRRPMGILFQDRRLFPWLTVRQNLSYGLRAQGRSASRIREITDHWLEEIGLTEKAEHLPGDLSGGQAQLTALARTLAPEPDILILDEPTAALDSENKGRLRTILKQILPRHPGPRILITHDPMEAVTLAETIQVLEEGKLIQEGNPEEFLRQPRSSFAATLVGLNFLTGDFTRGETLGWIQVAGGQIAVAESAFPTGTRVTAAIHPHAITLSRQKPEGSPRNVLAGHVTSLDREGDRVRVGLSTLPPLTAEVTPDAVKELDLEPGVRVWASLKATEIQVDPA